MATSETQLPNGEHQDATMVDVGERKKPPGDPPDGRGTWVKKVVGCGAGGRVRPELVLADEFVASRMELKFPNGDEGEPVIKIGDEVLQAMNELWKNCLIVKVLGRNVSIVAMTKKLREMWKPKGSMHVLDLPRQFFMVRFEIEEEYVAALSGGPWRVFGSYLLLQAWDPNFDPLQDEITTTPVWVRLSKLPLNFYHREILFGIARGLGNPVKVDLTTLNLERARFARVCVAVDLRKPLKGTVMVNDTRYFVSYEGMPNICSACGVYGHLVHSCPKRVNDLTVPVDTMNVAGTSATPAVANLERQLPENQAMQNDDGYTMVKRKGKNRNSPTAVNQRDVERVTPVNGDRRSLRDTTAGTDSGHIMISNSFVGLDVDSTSTELTKEKEEIQIMEHNGQQNNSVSRSKGITFGAQSVNVTGRASKGNNQKGINGRPMGKKYNRPIPTKTNNIGRGLVFGPTRSAENLSVSGKRMRVEEDTFGRAGGVFVTSKNGELESENNNPSMEEEKTGQMESSSPSKTMEKQSEPPVSTEGSMES